MTHCIGLVFNLIVNTVVGDFEYIGYILRGKIVVEYPKGS